MSQASLNIRDNETDSNDSYRAYGLMLHDIETALTQMASIQAMLNGFSVDIEAAISNELGKDSGHTPPTGREQEVAKKVEQSLVTILSRLEAAGTEQEFEQILSAAEEYLQSLSGKLGKNSSKKILEKLMLIEATLKTIREQLEITREQKQANSSQQQDGQRIMEALKKGDLSQLLERAKASVVSRLSEISKMAEKLAAQNSKLNSQQVQQQNQVANNAQMQMQQKANLSLTDRLMQMMGRPAETLNPANKNSQPAQQQGRISQMISQLAETANRLARSGQEAVMSAQKMAVVQAVLASPAIASPAMANPAVNNPNITNPSVVSAKVQETARESQQQVTRNNVVEINRQAVEQRTQSNTTAPETVRNNVVPIQDIARITLQQPNHFGTGMPDTGTRPNPIGNLPVNPIDRRITPEVISNPAPHTMPEPKVIPPEIKANPLPVLKPVPVSVKPSDPGKPLSVPSAPKPEVVAWGKGPSVELNPNTGGGNTFIPEGTPECCHPSHAERVRISQQQAAAQQGAVDL